MAKYKIAIIIGKTGSGKDSIFKGLQESETLHKVISTTTRPMREYEVDGVDYYFIDKYDFFEQDNFDKFLDTSVFNGWYYGTNIDNLDENKINILVGDNSRLLDLLTNDSVEAIIFYIEAFDKERLMRCLTREEDPDVHEIIRRFVAEEEDYGSKEFQLIDRYVRPAKTISNHDGELQEAIATITSAIESWAG